MYVLHVYMCVFIYIYVRQIHNAHVYGDTHIHIYVGNKFTFRKKGTWSIPTLPLCMSNFLCLKYHFYVTFEQELLIVHTL